MPLLAVLLARFLSARAAKLIAGILPFVLVAALVGGGVWYVAGLRSEVARQKVTVGYLSRQLAAGQAARTRDVAGLTAVTAALAKVSVNTNQRATIIRETVNEAPQPATPQLSAFLGRLRAAQSTEGVQRAATGASSGSTAPTRGAGSR